MPEAEHKTVSTIWPSDTARAATKQSTKLRHKYLLSDEICQASAVWKNRLGLQRCPTTAVRDADFAQYAPV